MDPAALTTSAAARPPRRGSSSPSARRVTTAPRTTRSPSARPERTSARSSTSAPTRTGTRLRDLALHAEHVAAAVAHQQRRAIHQGARVGSGREDLRSRVGARLDGCQPGRRWGHGPDRCASLRRPGRSRDRPAPPGAPNAPARIFARRRTFPHGGQSVDSGMSSSSTSAPVSWSTTTGSAPASSPWWARRSTMLPA